MTLLLTILFAALAALWLVGVLWMAQDIYITLRTERVRRFRSRIRELSYEWEARRIEEGNPVSGVRFRDKWDCDAMLYSFRPLRLERWYTADEIREICR